MIHINEASLGYQRGNEHTVVLGHLDLEIQKGELVGMIGRNGVGKSTLLKSICGLLPTLTGNIELDGKNIKSLSLPEVARMVAVVLTERIAGFNLSTFDLVAAGQMPYTNAFHQLNDQHHQVIEEALRLCGVADHQHKPLHELSDGLFQKANIARAIAQQTPIILLDEPTAFLDYASKHQLFLLVKELCKQGKTVVVSSHDLELISRYCDKALIIDDKEQVLLSIPEIKVHPAFQRITGGFL